MKTDFSLIEHYLVPAALVLLNICVMHFIYIISTRGLVIDGYSIFVCISFALLLAGVMLKKKVILSTAVMAYPLIIILTLV